MIATAVVCPHPPLLLRELGGAEDAVPELRAACHEGLGAALASRPDVVLVVAGADEGREWDPSLPVDVRRFGTSTAPRVAGLPDSLGVAKRLLEESGWDGPVRMTTVAWDADRSATAELAGSLAQVEGRAVLLVLGDGSSRRGERAPGHLDERAYAFDEQIGRALDAGDTEALAALDRSMAEQLMVAGRAAFAVLGEAFRAQGGARPRSRVVYRDDPYGVLYHVVVWQVA